MTELFETKPRWPGAPLICIAENLPAFETMGDLKKFLTKNGPGSSVIRTGKCQVCGMFHAKTGRRPKTS